MATITIPDHLEDRLQEMAREQGLSLIELLREFAGQKSLPMEPTQQERRAKLKPVTTEDNE
jgi:hypothetical protein